MSNTKTKGYDSPDTCNYCGSHKVFHEVIGYIDVGVGLGYPCEINVTCKNCGKEDKWGYGRYESSQHGHNKCEKYG